MEDAKLFMLKNKLLGVDIELYDDMLALNGGSINTFETPDFIRILDSVSHDFRCSTLILSKNLKVIGDACFESGSQVKGIISKSDKLNIRNNAFYHNYYLESIKLSGMSSVWVSSFELCKSLKSIDITGCSSLDVSHSAFANCENLEELIDLDKLDDLKIDSKAFMSCKSLKRIVFPLKVHINSLAFINCSSLKEVIFHNIELDDRIGCTTRGIFNDCSPDLTIKLPSKYKTMDLDFIFGTDYNGKNFSSIELY